MTSAFSAKMQSTMLLCAAWLAAVACPVAGLSAAVTTKVTEVAAAQVFARLADKKLLLDVPGAGTPEMKDCCHGGCDSQRPTNAKDGSLSR